MPMQVRLNASGTIQHVMMKGQASLFKVMNLVYLQNVLFKLIDSDKTPQSFLNCSNIID